MNTVYSIIGLGKLGASMAAAIASRGFSVIGVDLNQRAVDLVNAGHAPVQETMLEEIIAANRERVRATLSHHEAIMNSDVSFVIVPTPSDERGAFSLQYAKWAFQELDVFPDAEWRRRGLFSYSAGGERYGVECHCRSLGCPTRSFACDSN